MHRRGKSLSYSPRLGYIGVMISRTTLADAFDRPGSAAQGQNGRPPGDFSELRNVSLLSCLRTSA